MVSGFILFAEHNSQAWMYRYIKHQNNLPWWLRGGYHEELRKAYEEEAKIYQNIAADTINHNKTIKNRKKRKNMDVQEYYDNDLENNNNSNNQ